MTDLSQQRIQALGHQLTSNQENPMSEPFKATWVLTAPSRCGGRTKADRLIESAALDLTGWKVVIQFADATLSTTTFFDQLICRLVLERNAALVEFRNANPFTVERITERAVERNVTDRVVITSPTQEYA